MNTAHIRIIPAGARPEGITRKRLKWPHPCWDTELLVPIDERFRNVGYVKFKLLDDGKVSFTVLRLAGGIGTVYFGSSTFDGAEVRDGVIGPHADPLKVDGQEELVHGEQVVEGDPGNFTRHTYEIQEGGKGELFTVEIGIAKQRPTETAEV